MRSLFGGLVVGALGAFFTWLGFSLLLGWLGQSRVLALVFLCAGVTGILSAVYLQRARLARGYGIAGVAFLACAAGIALKLPELLKIENQQDVRLLWTTMGAGVSIFFGLASLIAMAMAKLMARDEP